MADQAAEVRELLRTSSSRWHTIALEGTEWRHHGRLREAAERSAIEVTPLTASRYRSNATAIRPARPEPQETTTESWRLWVAPGHRRAKYPVGGDPVDVVFTGVTWWSVGHGRAITNAGRENYGHGSGWGAALIETSEYVGFLEVREVGRATVLGREVKLVRATPNWNDAFQARIVLHALVIGAADELILAIDAERGVILRAESRLDGETYRILEVTAITFDEDFAAETFSIEPPTGQTWQEVSAPRSRRRR